MSAHSSSKQPAASRASKNLRGVITVPGDKSISHRALMLSAISVGEAWIDGLLESEDVINTAKALRLMGVPIEKGGERWHVKGQGIKGLHTPADVLDMGNSGTGVRLMMGLLAHYDFAAQFTGDESLCKRPMGRVTVPLAQMGVQFNAREEKFLPLTMRGGDLMPMRYVLPVASAQVKSAVLLAGVGTPGTTTVVEKELTRDHTELMLRHLGADITRTQTPEGLEISVKGVANLVAKNITVPADPSSAAFPIVAALITPGSEVTVTGVCMNPLRTGLFTTLKEMGADIDFNSQREQAGEPIADITARYSVLKGVTVPAERAPSMIDEYPVLSVAAAFASGETLMQGLAELRVKESDRLQAVADGLSANDVNYTIEGDNLRVQGGAGKVQGGGTVVTHMDHRLAMSFLVMGLASQQPVQVDDVSMINTSFPTFMGLMQGLGAEIA